VSVTSEEAWREPGGTTVSVARKGALARGLHIVEVLIESPIPMSLSEIAKAVGLENNTVIRLLKGLMETGYAIRHLGSKRYSAGPRALFPLRLYHPLNELRRQVHPRLFTVRERHGETASLVVFVGHERLLVDSVQGHEFLGPYYNDPWMNAPLHGSATGLLLLLAINDRERRRLLGPEPFEAHTPKTITEVAALERELAAIHERGFAVVHDTTFVGVSAVGAPIRAREKIVGCLVVAVGSSRIDAPRAAAIGADLVEAANLITHWAPALDTVGHFLWPERNPAARTR
jgi:IclR family transcriptional regulator, acetate operon repressor